LISTEYTEKLFKYVSVMICVADKRGDPFMGVVYFPFDNKVFWAWKDHGVSENLKNVKAVRVNSFIFLRYQSNTKINKYIPGPQ
jgi:fructose-1,6-bisphosphatase/inositol monophosphatase family enzyme